MTLPDFLLREPQGYIHFAGHRVGLHELLRLYNEGYSPEMLREYFPTLSLASIHKAIAFYLENQPQIDPYMAEQQALFQQQAAAAPRGPSIDELRSRMQTMRRAEGQ
jgi:uncharacterized protein (DUF433 family)